MSWRYMAARETLDGGEEGWTSDLAALLDAHEVLAEVRDQVKRGALCPMCATGMSRRTVGMVCQICGTDYGTR